MVSSDISVALKYDPSQNLNGQSTQSFSLHKACQKFVMLKLLKFTHGSLNISAQNVFQFAQSLFENYVNHE
jgi:hypothetical protein